MDLMVLCNHSMEDAQQLYKKFHKSYGEMSRAYAEVDYYLARIICSTGILANLMFVIVLMKPLMRTPINAILVAIAMCDASLMTTHMVYRFVPRCVTYQWAAFNMFYANLSVTAHSSSIWLTVLMAVLRYVFVHDTGLAASAWNQTRRAVTLCTLTVLCVGFVSVLNFARNQVNPVSIGLNPNCTANNRSIEYSVSPPEWWNCNLERTNFWVTGTLFKIIPCVLLTVFMTLLVLTLFEAKKRSARLHAGRSTASLSTRHHDRTTVMLISIVLIFLITELPQGILVVAIGIYPPAFVVYYLFGDVLDMLSLVNSSANFVLYCSMSQQFREQAVAIFIAPCQGNKNTNNSGRSTAYTRAKSTQHDMEGNCLTTTANFPDPSKSASNSVLTCSAV